MVDVDEFLKKRFPGEWIEPGYRKEWEDRLFTANRTGRPHPAMDGESSRAFNELREKEMPPTQVSREEFLDSIRNKMREGKPKYFCTKCGEYHYGDSKVFPEHIMFRAR